MFKLDTILYPTDFSKPSEYAFPLVCSMARDHGAKVLIVHVAPPPPVIVGDMMITEPFTTTDCTAQMWESFRKLQEGDPRARELRIETRVVEGDAPYAIVTAAKEAGADLIVMGTHGRTGLGRLVMGSVAENVLRTAPCPVLTVKSPRLVTAKAKPEPAGTR